MLRCALLCFRVQSHLAVVVASLRCSPARRASCRRQSGQNGQNPSNHFSNKFGVVSSLSFWLVACLRALSVFSGQPFETQAFCLTGDFCLNSAFVAFSLFFSVFLVVVVGAGALSFFLAKPFRTQAFCLSCIFFLNFTVLAFLAFWCFVFVWVSGALFLLFR